jgi:hypothetical protein
VPNKFLCPKCRSHLTVGAKIILSAKANDGSEGLISLDPVIGNYNVDFPPTLTHKVGDHLSLFCPVCHQNLASSKHINLAMLIATDESRQEFEVFFSQIVGEHSTVKMVGDHVDLFGEHVYKYQDLFKPRQMF